AVLVGEKLPENFSVPLFAFGGYAMSCLLFLTLLAAFRQRLPVVFESLLLVAIGFCNFVPFLLRRPLIYEDAICSGYFYFAAGLLLLVRHVVGVTQKLEW